MDKTQLAQQEQSGGCVRHAFQVGLRYMGRNEDLSWIPDAVIGSQEIWKIAERLGLKPLKTGNHTLDLIPAIVAYYEEGDEEGHAVFISDILPLMRQYKIIAVVAGFDEPYLKPIMDNEGDITHYQLVAKVPTFDEALEIINRPSE